MWMKRVVSILLAIFCLQLSGCNSSGTGEIRCQTEDYNILVRDGKWYIYLSEEMYSWCVELYGSINRKEEPLTTPDGEILTSGYTADLQTVWFDSVQHLRASFLTGDIPRTALYAWAKIGYPQGVRREFEIMDMDALYAPVIPEGVSLSKICINEPRGFGMGLIVERKPNAVKHERESLGVSYNVESMFRANFEFEYERDFERFRKDVKKGTKYAESINEETGVHTVVGRESDSYFSAPSTYVRYALNNSVPGYYVKKDGIDYEPDGTVYIIEKYQFGEFDSLASVYMYIPCKNGGISVILRNIYPTERNIEWLSQFGIRAV